MDVSVIIPVGDDVAGLAITLESLRRVAWDTSSVEVIVCNDGGGDAVSALAASFGCREARTELNRGSFAARNAGLAMATGPVLAFVDADQSVSPRWLEEGMAALHGADYVGGRVLVEEGSGMSFWKRIDATYAFPVEYYVEKMRFAPTANLFVARKVFESVGGFEESLRSGGDREFGVRVARHGFVQRYCPTATTMHPARGLREQLRKARRTAKGAARLEVLIWKRTAARLASNCAQASVMQLFNSARFLALHFIRYGGLRWNRMYLMTSGRLMVKAYSLACKAASAALQPTQRRSFTSRIPCIAPLSEHIGACRCMGQDASESHPSIPGCKRCIPPIHQWAPRAAPILMESSS